MAAKEELTDEQWAMISPLLPTPRPQPRGGRPWADNRAVFEGILWELRSGAAQWSTLEGSPGTLSKPLDLLEASEPVGGAGRLARYLARISANA